VEAEQIGAGRLDPEPQRGLVHRHKTRVVGGEEAVVPAGERILDGGSVVEVGVPPARQPGEVQEGGQGKDRTQEQKVPGHLTLDHALVVDGVDEKHVNHPLD
jgi:hypothetical protein